MHAQFEYAYFASRLTAPLAVRNVLIGVANGLTATAAVAVQTYTVMIYFRNNSIGLVVLS